MFYDRVVSGNGRVTRDLTNQGRPVGKKCIVLENTARRSSVIVNVN